MRPEPAPPDPRTIANNLLNRGDFSAAAEAYLNLAAESAQPDAARFQTLAALALQEAGDDARADGIIARVDETAAGIAPLVATAKACSMLASGFAEEAYALGARVDTAALSPYQRGRLARCLGQAALATNRTAAAAAALVSAWRYPVPAGAADPLALDTWRAVSRLPATELAAAAADAQPMEDGWYALGALAARAMFDPQQLAAGTADWRAAHPGHPGARVIDQMLERAEAMSTRPRRLALVLPFDDSLGNASKAIRDGFITAWYQDRRPGSRPELAIYSSAGEDPGAAITQALADGAEFIVGPLRKNLVETVRNDASIEVGVLALNTSDVPGGTRPGFFQFGLTPEDEAEQVARRAFDGGRRALVMAPDTDWGRRLSRAYSDAWRKLGGEIVADVVYRENAEAYAEAVRRGLAIDLSEARFAELRRTLNLPLHSEPRRRRDVDVVLLAAFVDNARQILPQLRYFRAEDIPVYATSHVYGGGTTLAADPDLDGVTFGDMPWLFGLADRDSFNLVRRSFRERAEGYARLYGFGVDAYRLLPHLARMRFQPGMRVPGVTGELWMDPDGVVHRRLTFLRFVDGLPTVAAPGGGGRRAERP